MSLINDALKRAKAAQAPPSALSAAHLRPVEPKHSTQHAAGLLLPIVLTLVALGGLFFLWQAAQLNNSENAVSPRRRPAFARPAQPTSRPLAAAVTAPAPAGSVAVPAQPLALASPAAAAAPASPTKAVVAAPPAPAVSGPAPAATSTPATNVLTVAQAVAPTPTPLRLQAIVFHPTRPSAMVNGKTVFVGDRVGEYRVLAIDHDSATLAAPTRTNVLSLSE